MSLQAVSYHHVGGRNRGSGTARRFAEGPTTSRKAPHTRSFDSPSRVCRRVYLHRACDSESAEITEALLAHLHPVAFDNLWTHTAALGSVFFSSVSLLSVPGVHAYHLRFPLLFCCSSSSVTLPLPLRNARVYHGSKSCHSPANRFKCPCLEAYGESGRGAHVV